jgi:hypothetical protein
MSTNIVSNTSEQTDENLGEMSIKADDGLIGSALNKIADIGITILGF